MASYQNDYLKMKNDPQAYVKAISDWELSKERKAMINAWDYYKGDNPTIREVERYYYSDFKKKTVDGKEITVGGGQVVNKYVANFKIGYGITKDIVGQKVNTLLDEIPSIITDKEYFKDNWQKQYGYALKNAAIRASVQSVGYIFQDYNGNFSVFKSENVIPFFDDETGKLKTAIRFWRVTYNNAVSSVLFFEVYKETTMVTYSYEKNIFAIVKNELPYKFTAKKDIDDITITNDGVSIPIILLKNNEEMTSDLTPALISKIDAIDLVNSGFANNIADFSELIWVVKNYSGRNAEELEDFVANIQRTRKLTITGNGADVDAKQTIIPTEARRLFVEDRKKEIIEETGILDTTSLTGSSLTTTAIKAATMRLRQRVSDFEWQVYETANNLIYLWQIYNDIYFDFDIDFTELLIQNDTEMIDNAVKIRTDISKKSLLEIYQKAGYINNVEDELNEIAKESIDKFTISDNDENGVSDGQGTQGNGQDIVSNTNADEEALPTTLQSTEN